MSLHLSAGSEAIAMIEQLQRELEILLEVLRASKDHVRVDAMFSMGFRPDDEVHNDPIEVRQLEGDEAIEAAFEALTNIWVKKGQQPRETLRAPGVIALPRVAIEKILLTNELRTEINRVVSTIEDSKDRRLVWAKFKGSDKGIVSKQVLRLTSVLSAPHRVNFYWDDTGSASTRHVAGELLKDWEKALDELHDQRPTKESALEGSVEMKLLVAIDLIQKLDPMEQVAISRIVQPHIRARVRNGAAKIRPFHCPVPFVYDIDAWRTPPRIKPLRSFVPHGPERKKKGLNLLEAQPYIESMDLYRYEDMHRKFGPLKKNSDGHAPDSATQKKGK